MLNLNIKITICVIRTIVKNCIGIYNKFKKRKKMEHNKHHNL